MTLEIRIPNHDDALRLAIVRELEFAGIEFSETPYGTVFEDGTGRSPGVEGHRIKITDAVGAAAAVISALAAVVNVWTLPDSAETDAVRIKTQHQSVEIRDSTDIEASVRLLRQLQESEPPNNARELTPEE